MCLGFCPYFTLVTDLSNRPQRTLGDVLCDTTELAKVQKWVTLQPNNDYNPYRYFLEKFLARFLSFLPG
jgi:hypothetical protein